jgi:hypothetical protein
MATVTFPSLTPGDSYTDNNLLGGSIAVGMACRATVPDVKVIALRFYAWVEMSVTPFVWDADGKVVATGLTKICAPGWNYLPLAVPLAAPPGVDLVVGVTSWPGQRYTAVVGALPLVGAHMTATGSRYRYDWPYLSMASDASTAWFGVDVVTTTDAIVLEPDPTPGPEPVPSPEGPYFPTNELVVEAWLSQHVPGLVAAMVATSLPKDPTTWAESGFLQVQALPGGSPDVDIPVRHPVFQIDAWATRPGSSKPPWHLANRLIELVRNATESTAAYGRPVTMPPNYLGARVQAAYLISEPRRVTDDPAGYARFTADLAVDWVRA